MINGLGMGNSTRCHAVIKKLSAVMDVHVLTGGNGATFFQDKTEIKSLNIMDSLFYAKKEGGISMARTFMSIRDLIRLARKKSE
jgi:predicted glycosyltransferase